jgi:dTDP-L-rhamnose 4-epimerase
MNKVLITGGAGFIGSSLALHLHRKGYFVRVLDNLSPQVHGEYPEHSSLYLSIRNHVEFVYGSITDETVLTEALEGVTSVIHLAAETGTGQSMYEIRHYTDVNICGTALLLDLIASRKDYISKIIVASSRAVYGEGKYYCNEDGFVYPSGRDKIKMQVGDFSVRCPICNGKVMEVATDEGSLVNPSSIYGITKLTQEQMILAASKAIGISSIALRYQNVYGPGQSLSNPYTGILSIFSTRIKNRRSINIFEDGLETRDFVYIDDVISATIMALEYKQPIVDVFNVGSGKANTIIDIAYSLQNLFGLNVDTKISGEFRVGDIRHNFADLKKISNAFGFIPKVSIDEGLTAFVQWAVSQSPTKDLYDASLHELKLRGLMK